MMFSEYCRIKDRICLAYFGDLNADDVEGVEKVRTELKTRYPEWKVFVSCRNEYAGHFSDCIPQSEFRKSDFLTVREVPVKIAEFWKYIDV